MTRRFVTAPDGRAIGEYGSSASDVRAEFIWMSPEVGDSGVFGGDDGLGGYMPIALATAASGGGTTLNWVHGDHLGTPIVITDATGTAIPQPGGYTTPAFPGQSRTLYDLYYNRYRDYDPTTGRYIQADPIGLAGGQSPYSYAMGNPLRYTDPTGEFAVLLPLLVPVGEAAIACLINPLCRLGAAVLFTSLIYDGCNDGNVLTLNRGSGGNRGYGGGMFGDPPLTDNEPGDDCDVEYKQEMEYCQRKYGVSPSQYDQCTSRAGTNLGLCKSGGRALGWWRDVHMDGIETPLRPSPKRRRW